MLKKCANPLCPNPFRVLSQGKLFQMEVDDFVACANRKRSPRRVEHYWLCDRCCSSFNPDFRKRTRNGDGAPALPQNAAHHRGLRNHAGSATISCCSKIALGDERSGMQKSRVYTCVICGEEKPDHDSWFLLAENQWEDKLKVLQWNKQLAKSGALACSPAHVEELVIHWMTTGSLDYPFARTSTRPRWRPRQPWRASCDLDMIGVRQIGELAVDRESIERVLSDSPQSLQTILDALMDALRQETSSLYQAVESEEEEELLAIPQEV